MTCKNRACRHEFCWICMGPWKEHGGATGGYFQCNKWKGGGATRAAQETREAKKREEKMSRFIHYIERYTAHDQSRKLEQAMLEKVDMRREQLQLATFAHVDTAFLENAFRELLQNRLLLRNTFVFAFYNFKSTRTNSSKDEFEELQGVVEGSTEHLSDIIARAHLRHTRGQVIESALRARAARMKFNKFMKDWIHSKNSFKRATSRRTTGRMVASPRQPPRPRHSQLTRGERRSGTRVIRRRNSSPRNIREHFMERGNVHSSRNNRGSLLTALLRMDNQNEQNRARTNSTPSSRIAAATRSTSNPLSSALASQNDSGESSTLGEVNSTNLVANLISSDSDNEDDERSQLQEALEASMRDSQRVVDERSQLEAALAASLQMHTSAARDKARRQNSAGTFVAMNHHSNSSNTDEDMGAALAASLLSVSSSRTNAVSRNSSYQARKSTDKWGAKANAEGGDIASLSQISLHALEEALATTVPSARERTTASTSGNIWACPTCTFHNETMHNVCNMCGTEKPPQ